MSPDRTHPRRPALQRGLDTSTGAGFLRERLALQGKTLFLVSFSFWIFLIANLVLVGGAPLAAVLLSPIALGHIAGSSTMGLVWLLARRPTISLAGLGAVDAVGIVGGCSCLAFMTVGTESQVLQVLLAVMVTVMLRAILVPSTPGRTLLLTALAFTPTVMVCLILHHGEGTLPGFTPGFQKLHMSLNTVLWSVLGVTLATVTSQVTYGLRQQLREASEIGPYTLEEKIGSGGMGEVWRARHRMLIRPAAVKLVTARELGSEPEHDPELRLRRFEREARATAGLKSPHTVELYDFGVTNDGTLYYVMELLDGLDLDTLITRFGPVAAERAIHLLLQVCASLDDAHQNGLVHRDIKPANIVVSRVSAAWDFVKVLDFGLVKLEGARQSEKSVKLTAENSVSGTPGFIAPEVVLGDKTDHRVDIYSLGCVGYWLITGKLVFEGPSAIKVMSDHVHTAPAPPSSRSELPIPRELDTLILECLEKDPAKRPATASALQSRLQAIPIATPWTRERAEAWWSDHAPGISSTRPVADVLLSQEARPARVIRQARH